MRNRVPLALAQVRRNTGKFGHVSFTCHVQTQHRPDNRREALTTSCWSIHVLRNTSKGHLPQRLSRSHNEHTRSPALNTFAAAQKCQVDKVVAAHANTHTHSRRAAKIFIRTVASQTVLQKKETTLFTSRSPKIQLTRDFMTVSP